MTPQPEVPLVRDGLPRFLRYGGVSVVAALLAQVGLAVGYGLLRWSTTEAVALSLAVSAVPAYWLSSRFVWPGAKRTGSAGTFVALALAGSAITAGTVAMANHVGHLLTENHAVLALAVNATALATTVVVWALRFVVLDRVMLVRQPAGDAA